MGLFRKLQSLYREKHSFDEYTSRAQPQQKRAEEIVDRGLKNSVKKNSSRSLTYKGSSYTYGKQKYKSNLGLVK